MRRGFSLLELVIVLTIAAILLLVVLIPYNNLRQRQTLRGGAEDLVAFISRARSETLAAVGGFNHGIHLSATQAELFSGSTYPGTSEGALTFNSSLTLSGISLAGGGDDIIFEKLSGATSQAGSLTLSLVSDSSQAITITVEPTGLVWVSS